MTAQPNPPRAAILCNDARESADGWRGDPTEIALLRSASELQDPAAVRSECPRIDEIPFDAAYRFMATLHRGPEGEPVMYVKGAPERLLELARGADREYWQARIAEAGIQQLPERQRLQRLGSAPGEQQGRTPRRLPDTSLPRARR